MGTSLKSKIIYPIVGAVGNMLVFMQPKKARQLSEHRMTLVHKNSKKMSLSERLMRFALVKKLEKIENHEKIAEMNRNFWESNKATDLFSETESAFINDFLPNCTFIFDLLDKELINQPEKFHTLVEIGTGNGDVLNYLSSKFHQINRFIGIDLSSHQVEINKKKFSDNIKLEFVAADAFDWVKEHGCGNSIFVSSKGVLEYFVEQRLQEFLNIINQQGKTMFVAIEPNGADHNFDTQPNTQLYGNEPSFSHNYPHLFKNAGFTLWHFSQQTWPRGSDLQTFIGAKN